MHILKGMRRNIVIKQAPKCYSVKEVVRENNVKDLLRNLRNTFLRLKLPGKRLQSFFLFHCC
eukprot:GAHX01003839.1.p1 GENE.GAHX01003839.1~~GAHX01003839.1.p1  ORF type:complete len:62 (-),score=4.17 GAHX01003839.1:386-571(-)